VADADELLAPAEDVDHAILINVGDPVAIVT